MKDLFHLNATAQQVNSVTNLGLAHIGDGVYELMVRAYLVQRGGKTVKTLHRDTISLVNAPAQAAHMDKILPLLTQEELDYYRRGKNTHTHAAPKAASPQEYAKATGLETLFGALYLLGHTQRLNELFDAMIKE